ncbi:hypothetical protein HU200_021982 [Digitaria exilis]|uniref:VWFA domain-containing protein n=1 Tax=Digitaria exilis TaxID=1010633 RepID=A0A835CAX7_9POAL|nr:hypothetical protein HU200_021982 [Digitaria exilis]
MFQDDDPLELPAATTGGATPPATNGGLVLKTQCDFPSLGRNTSRDKFAVLVDAKAPADVARAPLDLVTVLDVSGSMKGQKLELLKHAMCFVIDQLCPSDRLSVVTFSDAASRLTRLARMSPPGKAAAKLAVASLVTVNGTNIADGLRVGAQVLFARRHRNVVSGMILLSDGHDTVLPKTSTNGGARNYANLVPPSFTFGFGSNHDAAAMHAVAATTGGTFSFVQDQSAIQDAFARCVGGLLSVAVQEARIAVTCLHRGVRIQEVKSGSYASHIDTDGRSATIDAGELYDDEGRRFLVLVYVPRARATEETTRLVKVSCTHKIAATGQAATAAAPAAVIKRPLELTHMPPPAMEVERERVRLAATEDIAAARVAADGGQHAGAARILSSRALKEELRDLSARVGDRQEYQQTGRACLLAGMSSHAQQRASGVELQGSGSKTTMAYLTPKMEEMVELSRESSSSGRKRGSNTQEPDGVSSRIIKQIKEDLSD